MKRTFSTKFIAYSFISAATMLWLGWMLLSTHIGTFFKPDDFEQIYLKWSWWIWWYRIHLFGHVISVVALTALGSQFVNSEARVMLWPGIVVASAGIFVTALASAFYYHHGAWGAMEMHGKSPEQIVAFVELLRIDTEYVTCLVRFGRVFSGLGLLLLGIGLFKWNILPLSVSGGAALIGTAAMALTMGLPDMLSLYMPIFHLKALWLLGTGVFVLRSRMRPAT